MNKYNLEKIENLCKNDEKKFKILDDLSSKNYAFVIYFSDIKNLSFYLVFAKSLKLVNTKADIIIMISSDLDDDVMNLLRTSFNKIIKVQTHYDKFDNFFTRFKCLNFTEYKKIILINDNIIFIRNIDSLFSVKSPACTLSNINIDTTTQVNLSNVKKYCKNKNHNKLINYGLDELDKFNILDILVLKPNKKKYKKFFKNLYDYLNNKNISSPNDFLINYFFGKIRYIDERFLGINGFPDLRILYGIKFLDSPYSNKIDINSLINNNINIIWHNIFNKLINDSHIISDEKKFKDIIDLNSLFFSRLNKSKKLLSRDFHDKNSISKIYEISEKRINNPNLYFINKKNEYIPKFVKKMYDIKINDFITPIKNIKLYLNSDNYYTKLYEKIKNKKMLDLYDNKIDEIDRDLIVLEYIKCRPNTFVITLWPISSNYKNVVIEKLKNDGNLFYIKDIKLSKNGVKNLMGAYYNEFDTSTRLTFIEKKLDYTKTKEKDNDVCILFFENTQNLKISGQAAKYKNILRSLLKKELDDTKIYGNDLIHINDLFYQTIEYSQLVLNKNSLHLLENQNLNRFYDDKFSLSLLKFQTLRTFIYKNFTQEETIRSIIIGSLILNLIGLRISNDIDGIILNIKKKDEYFEKMVNYNLTNKKTKIFFIDLGIIEGFGWRESWDNKNYKLFQNCNIKDYDDLITNPRNYFFYGGIKFYLLEFEIIRKIMRFTKKDILDLKMLNKLYSINQDIYKIKNDDIKVLKNIKYIDYENKDIDYGIDFKSLYLDSDFD